MGPFHINKKKQSELKIAISTLYQQDETFCVEALLSMASFSSENEMRIAQRAKKMVEQVRLRRSNERGVGAFLQQFSLSSEEGVSLMCLAESLLRIPDSSTRDKLIRDKIASQDWLQQTGKSASFYVNAAAWGLMLTGKVVSHPSPDGMSLAKTIKKLVSRSGEPIIRTAISYAMKMLGNQFVMGETIQLAIKRAKQNEKKGYTYSYDMLGESARTQQDAEKYYQSYISALESIKTAAVDTRLINNPGISIKLSALYPRYEYSQHTHALDALVPRVLHLAQMARQANICVTIDAEEANTLDLMLDVFEAVFSSPMLEGWEGLGLAVQSYLKCAPSVIDWLADLSKRHGRRIMVRLIKGAYWDTEIKNSQVLGLSSYPVFTRKSSTDVSFLVCAKKILQHTSQIYPMFATHNAHTVSAVIEMAESYQDYEFQCLHGMGDALYDQLLDEQTKQYRCRIYAPVGGYNDLLAYLVRRMLENGANSSFVSQIMDSTLDSDMLIADPIKQTRLLTHKPHPRIPLPMDLYGATRKNSMGIDLSQSSELTKLYEKMRVYSEKMHEAYPLPGKRPVDTASAVVKNPANQSQVVGYTWHASDQRVKQAVHEANTAALGWNRLPVDKRAACLLRAADLFEARISDFIAMAVLEAGKTIPDALAEVREAIDFCRYYAEQSIVIQSIPQLLPGPTGEHNTLQLSARGVIVCISPWNFPLAIFIGQISAALVMGNAVIAKPAEQTPLIAAEAIRVLYEAGVPEAVLQFLPGDGETVGAQLVASPHIDGVIFTGSTDTARMINQTLAKKSGPIVPLIAETGGQNAMIVDSSALLEQVVDDVMASAFGSAGQRCSALRVLFAQENIADDLIVMLKGAMAEWVVGNPADLDTDCGPVIDKAALAMLEEHTDRMKSKLLYQVQMDQRITDGFFMMPCLIELTSLSELSKEVFGPVLHIIRYAERDLDRVINEINQTGYGLTLGIHSRINETIEHIVQSIHVGNCYINRNMVGAVVGVQPFGGQGLSGTGPKAGGPHYLPRLCHERTVTINTTAAGGNASLFCLDSGL